jgi:ATP-dependent DNA helicase RecG
MNKAELETLLMRLIARWEGEITEFKRATDTFSTSDIGKYFSALANEANLRNEEKAWLVFGVDNSSRQVVGTDYRLEPERLQSLKLQISSDTEPSITLRDIHELHLPQGRVLLLEVPAAPLGMPIAWKGHYYARAGESLTHLGLDKLDELRGQIGASDWTSQVVEGATSADLDLQALAKARDSFVKKYANRFTFEEVSAWPDTAFLDRARLTQKGYITRATLLLLGKAESAYRLSPHPAQISWKLEGSERAYLHFAPPFLLSTTELYQKIRNVPLRILPDDQLVPVEVAKYDQKIVLEALHNCIAHQDYARSGRVLVIELPDRLIFESEGTFFEGQPTDYITGHKTPRRYRNPFLIQAMTELNMIDTMGYGIHEMHLGQARRYFPMPDYDLSESGAVKLTIHGSVVDVAYSRMLIQKSNLSLTDILALDRVQKKLPIEDALAHKLRTARLIEGRKPKYQVFAAIAQLTANKADYIRMRSQDDVFYAKLLTNYLEKFDQATRQEVNQLLFPKLSEALDERQKTNKINNLLTKLRRKSIIENHGVDSAPQWRLAEKFAEKK